MESLQELYQYIEHRELSVPPIAAKLMQGQDPEESTIVTASDEVGQTSASAPVEKASCKISGCSFNETKVKGETVDDGLGQERRRAPDGSAYTKSEFVAFFNGTSEWECGEEVRCSPDGGVYTQKEFITYFGGTDEWDLAEGYWEHTNSKTVKRSLRTRDIC